MQLCLSSADALCYGFTMNSERQRRVKCTSKQTSLRRALPGAKCRKAKNQSQESGGFTSWQLSILICLHSRDPKISLPLPRLPITHARKSESGILGGSRVWFILNLFSPKAWPRWRGKNSGSRLKPKKERGTRSRPGLSRLPYLWSLIRIAAAGFPRTLPGSFAEGSTLPWTSRSMNQRSGRREAPEPRTLTPICKSQTVTSTAQSSGSFPKCQAVKWKYSETCGNEQYAGTLTTPALPTFLSL